MSTFLLKNEVRDRWLTALRDGSYSQTRGRLKDFGGFCSLGVLCDVTKNETGGKWTKLDTFYGYESFSGSMTYTPWLVLDYVTPQPNDVSLRLWPTLIQMNDSGASFEQIADYIEAHTIGVE